MLAKTINFSQNEQLINRVISGHKRRFGCPPQAAAYAPGRIEVLGNHTDYNEGYVLSAAIDAGLCVAVSAGEGKRCILSALDVGENAKFDLPAEKPIKNPHWANYLIGVTNKLGAMGKIERGFNLTFAGDVPPGAGLSSSAALEVAAALALCSVFNLKHRNFNGVTRIKAQRNKVVIPAGLLRRSKALGYEGWKAGIQSQNKYLDSHFHGNDIKKDYAPGKFDLIQLARLCQQAENEFTGARCGLLDQISSLFGAEQALIFTDFRSLTIATEKIGTEMCFLLANTGVKHNLVESAYNERRESCEKAALYFASVLNHPVKALRDVSPAELKKHSAGLDPLIFKRAAHIIGENERVLKARKFLQTGDMKNFGKLMFESHESSRVNFMNSCEELDFIVETASGLKEVLGARLSGGGFGGSAVLLINPKNAAEIGGKISSAYAKRFGAACQVRVVQPSAGAQLLNNE